MQAAGVEVDARRPIGRSFTRPTLSDPEDRRGAHWTDSDVLLVYAPGSSPEIGGRQPGEIYPAGGKLLFRADYTKSGKSRQRPNQRGVDFCETDSHATSLMLQLTSDHFVIPPGARTTVWSTRDFAQRRDAAQLFPQHMHRPGKRFEQHHSPGEEFGRAAGPESGNSAGILIIISTGR